MERKSKTDNIQSGRGGEQLLNPMDRKILGALVEDATQSYAALATRVGLSAPAVHERVKRLRRHGLIKETVARLDGAKIGKPLLVFLHVETQNWGYSKAFEKLKQLPEIEELHSVTGGTSLILKVRLPNSTALESLLRQIHQFDSVVSTKSFVTLSTYKDSPVQAQDTEDWPEPPLPEE